MLTQSSRPRSTALAVRRKRSQVRSTGGVLWDPRVRVHRAPAYRYAALAAALTRAGHAFEDRVPHPGASPVNPWSIPSLRPYQAAALAAWELSEARGLVILPTGSGKTRLAMAAMASRDARVLCLVPTRVLLEQWRTELSKEYAGPIGQYGDGMRKLEALTVATFASAFHHGSRAASGSEQPDTVTVPRSNSSRTGTRAGRRNRRAG